MLDRRNWLKGAIGLVVVSLLAACKTGPLSQDAFGQRFVEKVRSESPTSTVQQEDEYVRWSTPEQGERQMYLVRWYARYREQPEALETILDDMWNQVETFSSELGTTGVNDILPVVKTTAWMEEYRVRGGGRLPVWLPLAGDLVLWFAEDSERSMVFVTPERAKQLKLDKEQLLAISKENLARQLPELEITADGGRYFLGLDGNYEGSLPLIFEKWSDRLGKLDGDPVFIIPGRGACVVCGSNDTLSIGILQKVTQLEFEYPLSTSLYVWKDGGLKVFTP